MHCRSSTVPICSFTVQQCTCLYYLPFILPRRPRLTQPDPPSCIENLLRWGSNLQYSGRTFRQTQKAKLDRLDNNFTRYVCQSHIRTLCYTAWTTRPVTGRIEGPFPWCHSSTRELAVGAATPTPLLWMVYYQAVHTDRTTGVW